MSESEKNLSISIGSNYEINWSNRRKLDLSFATFRLGNSTYSSTLNSGLKVKKFTYLTGFRYEGLGVFSEGRALFSENADLLLGNFKGDYVYDHLRFSGEYEYVNPVTDKRLDKDVQNFTFSSSYNFFKNTELSTVGRYDLMENRLASTSFGISTSSGLWDYNFFQSYLKHKAETLSASAVYTDDCTKITMSFEKRYQEIGSSKPVQTIAFRVQLKPLAKFVFSQGLESFDQISSTF